MAENERDIPAAPAGAWHYLAQNSQQDPVSESELRALFAAGLPPETHVWREGMADWARACDLPELGLSAGLAAPPPVNGSKASFAKGVCVTLFVVFCLAFLVNIGQTASPPERPIDGSPEYRLGCAIGQFACAGLPVLLGAPFAAIYLPLRWRVIRTLGSGPRTLGLIGGIGLNAMFALAVIGLLLWFL